MGEVIISDILIPLIVTIVGAYIILKVDKSFLKLLAAVAVIGAMIALISNISSTGTNPPSSKGTETDSDKGNSAGSTEGQKGENDDGNDGASSSGEPGDTSVTPESPVETDLFQMQEFIGDVGDFVYYNDGTPDNTGCSRLYRIYCTNLYSHNNGFREVTYKLNGEFRRLEFTLALSSANNDTKRHAWLEFRNGDELIQATDQFTAGSEPKEYSIPLSGVDKLVITARCDGSSYDLSSYVDLLSTEFRLIK